jgi:hypothetical protein
VISDASAVLDLVYATMKQFGTELTDWELAALGSATKFLKRVTSAAA